MPNLSRSFVIPVTPIIFGPASEFGSTWLRHQWNMICTDLHQSCDDFVGTKRLRFLASPWFFATPSITLMAASSCRMLTSLKNWPYQRQPMIDICGWSLLYYLIPKKWMANFPPHLVSDLDRLMDFVDLNTQGSNLIKQLLSMSILLDLETEWNRVKPNETEWNSWPLMASIVISMATEILRESHKTTGTDKNWFARNIKKPTWMILDSLGLGRGILRVHNPLLRKLLWNLVTIWIWYCCFENTERRSATLAIDSHSNWNSAHTHTHIYIYTYDHIRWRDLMAFRTWRKRLRTQLQANSASHGRHHQQHDTNRMDWIWINDGLDLSKVLLYQRFPANCFATAIARTASSTWVELGTLHIGSYQIISYIISIYYQFDKNGGCMDHRT